MSENNNERLSRKDRLSRGQGVSPGGYIGRENNEQQKQPLRANGTQGGEQLRRKASPNPSSPNPSSSSRRISSPIGKTSFRRSGNSSRQTPPVRKPQPNGSQASKVAAGGGGQPPRPPRKRISVPKPSGKGSVWWKVLKYGLYAASVAVIFVFCLCVFWIYQAPAFDSKILDNNSRTIVYDVNNQEVAKLGNQVGENLETKDIPKKMQDAILATEDNRFFEHGAVDYKRLVGAVFSNLTSGFGSQGASTISQQLIKRTFLDDNKNVKRKVQEAYLAYKLEQNYDKETIFTMYVNRIYYSDGVYGLKTAAKYYYNKDLSQLTLPQMALLAGIPQHPNTYNPYDSPESAKSRRDTVLYLMKYHGKITEAEETAAKQTSVLDGIVPRNESTRVILSSEFDSRYTGYMNELVSELKNSKEYKDYEGDVLNLGLKVYTNFDPQIQNTLSESVNANYAGIKQVSNVSMVVLNNENSGIAAIYGGKNQTFNGFNVATQAKLQPGSTAKPVLAYGPAIEYLGWDSGHILNDSPISGSKIQNWDRQFHGNITMNNALMMSYNIPAIKAYQEVGFSNVQKFAKSVGLDIKDDSLTTPIGGSSDGFSPLQMAASYVPFSNGGYYATPKAIKKVYDSEGTEVKSFNTTDRKRVMKDSTAYIMTSMLRNVVNGTAQSAAVGGVDLAVKTGTTTFGTDEAKKYNIDANNAAKDSWIVGYTTGYTLSVWQGFDSIDSSTKYLSDSDTNKTQILFRINMQYINRLHPAKGFSIPNDVGSINGAVKVLTDEDRRAQEQNSRENNMSNNDNRQQPQEQPMQPNNNQNSQNNQNTQNQTTNTPATRQNQNTGRTTNSQTNNNNNNR